jgi:predicted ATPase/DNA-binding SARP family transcriptional activator
MPATAIGARLSLLGPPVLRADGAETPLPRDKRLHLLAFLAVHGDWVDRDRLADLFWPRATGGASRRNLRQLLVRVREGAWPEGLLDALDVDRQRMRWPLATDVEDFVKAAERGDRAAALDAYRGSFLAGAGSYDETPFAEWVELERQKLHFTWRDVILARATELAAAGRPEEATVLLERLLALDDLDEEALTAFMRLCAADGRPAQAMRAYRGFRQRLDREMGLAPASPTALLADEIESTARMAAANESTAAAVERRTMPAPGTRLIGRDLELAELAHLLSDPHRRLVTVLGPGGAGKTRLALEVARELAPSFPGGALFVELEAAGEAQDLGAVIAAAAGVRLGTEDDAFDQIARSFGSERRLVVLDAFEHLVAGAGRLTRLLRACPGLVIVVTSRIRLDIAAEYVVQLGGLSVPIAGTPDEEASAYDAVVLFIERARRVHPAFDPPAAAVGAIVRICRLLGGLPLGIELASAWVRVMDPAEIATEIERDLDFLHGSGRDVNVRHLSIRACFEASWRLLSPSEQEALSRVSVFEGGFGRDAASFVAGAGIALLAALVDKSLLRVDDVNRFDGHALVLQFAAERFAASSARTAVRDRHATYFLDLAESARRGLAGPQQAAWNARLEREHRNLESAAGWYLGEGADAERALRLCASLWRFWWARGYARAGRDLLHTALAMPGSERAPSRGDALSAAGMLSWALGDPEVAERHLSAAMSAHERTGDLQGMARSLNGLCNVATERCDYATATTHLLASLELWRATDSRDGIATAIGNLGSLARLQGDFVEARRLMEESLALERELGAPGPVALTLRNLGHVALSLGDLGAAAEWFAESKSVAEDVGDQWTLALALSGEGSLALAHRDDDAARQAFERSLTLRRAAADTSGVGYMLVHLAGIDVRAGDHAGAAERLAEARGALDAAEDPRGLAAVTRAEADLAHATGDHPAFRARLAAALEQSVALGDRQGIAACLERAAVDETARRPRVAAQLFGSAEALRDLLGIPLVGHELAVHQESVLVRGRHPDHDEAWADGRTAAVEPAVATALQNLRSTVGAAARGDDPPATVAPEA